MDTVLCPYCGEHRLGSFRYCRNCGFDFEDAAHSEDVRGAVAPPGSSGDALTDDSRVRPGYVLLLLAGACLAASVPVATANVTTPQAVRIAVAVLIVFILPGFAAVSAVLPPWRLSSGERLFASLGISLAVATCTAVLLAATPIGLSRESFAVALAGSTITLSIVALLRSLTRFRWRSGHNGRSGESPSEGVSS